MVTFVDGGTPVITGTDAMTTPGGYQFAVTGGNGPYTWSISGTGASIDQNGYVTLSGACGTFFVSCTDCTGRSAQHAGTRVTNNGTWGDESSGWVEALSCHPLWTLSRPFPCQPWAGHHPVTWGLVTCYSGNMKAKEYFASFKDDVPGWNDRCECAGICTQVDYDVWDEEDWHLYPQYRRQTFVYLWTC